MVARPEDTWTPPSDWCPHPGRWSAEDAFGTEWEVSALIAGLVCALQPDVVVETGTYRAQTAAAIGEQLAANGQGHLWTFETDTHLAQRARVLVAKPPALPVTVVAGALTAAASPPWGAGPVVGMAFLDSSVAARPGELEALDRWLAPGAVVAVHDTAPQHGMLPHLAAVTARLGMVAMTLHTPRGLTLIQRQEDPADGP